MFVIFFFLLIYEHVLGKWKRKGRERGRGREKVINNGNLTGINKSQTEVCNITNQHKRFFRKSANKSILEYIHCCSDKSYCCDTK